MEKLSVRKLNVIENLNKVFDPHFWDCSKPITVSTAKTAEGIAQDVKKAETAKIPKINVSKLNIDYTKFKNLNAEDLKLSQKTIPNYILACTGAGILFEGVAYAVKLPWFAPVLLFGGAAVFLVMKFEDIRKAEECY